MISVLLISCNSANYEAKFAKCPKKQLQTELFFEDDSLIYMGNTHQLCVEDSFVIILDKYDDKSFTLINTTDKKAVRACPVGQGPGEVINPSSYVTIDKNDMYVFDISYSKMFVYDLYNILTNPETKAFKTIDISSGTTEKGGFSTGIQMINDSLWIGTGLFYNGVFSFYKNGIRESEQIDLFIDELPAVAPIQRAARDANIFRLSIDKKHLVRATQLAGFFGVYKIENDMILSEKFAYKYFKDEVKVVDKNTLISTANSRYGYIDVCISDKKAYGLYSGKPDEPNGYQSKNIHVYDFDGNLHEIIELDTPICAIDINNEGDTIYAIAAEGERRILSINLNQ